MNSLWQIKQNLESARQIVSELCNGHRGWVMSIPAQPDKDPDFVISRALHDAEMMLEKLEQLEERKQP